MMVRKCELCEWFFPQDNDGERGVCKHNPPVPFPVQTIDALQQPQMQVIAIVPPVTGADYCGKFSALQTELDLS